ncbi:hypothetical protein SS1G_01830 [Sclerotinia sclerotiorum 1980 UF-70]|uniref:Uncharacterized protein n=1 Tax=Sclerotinia sclerotiorum (strain ATCC 18683 / 1980 / Ss-1) TaxID=665079 RepID=A7E950_SCLS1|nr:hypothetical protein SS1G_01830 [Sclerotinia sclerotiorum 1980 UF-70]EDN96902.1 hypothetical protein SS1G_01830 [Sclerotinia sclerotiorum 1980 UF-70]
MVAFKYITSQAREGKILPSGRSNVVKNHVQTFCHQANQSFLSFLTGHNTDHNTPAKSSHAVQTPFGVFVSGQLPADFEGNLVQGTIREKTEAVFKNLQEVLITANSSLDKIVKVQVFLTDMKDFAEMNEEYEKWITHKPARSCVAVKELPKGVNIEIECIALP